MCSPSRSGPLCLLLILLSAGCRVEREAAFEAGNVPDGNRVTPFQPGPPDTRPQIVRTGLDGDDVLADGQRLYQQFNCAGCHANGGGAIGPPLMDHEWIYGGSPDNIFWTIVEGRPQGMPSFGGRIAEGHLWKIVAYVRSLSASAPAEPPAGDAPAGDATGSAQPGSPSPVSDGEALIAHGQEVFLQGPCALCHTVRGTRALATVGPDLTHLASRRTLAGTLPNTRGNLAGWILNPQNLKPGTQMPPTLLEAQDLQALLSYLESLE